MTSSIRTTHQAPVGNDDPMGLFVQRFRERERVEQRRKDSVARQVDEKSRILIPIRRLLKNLMDAGVWVLHQNAFLPNVLGQMYEPQELKVFEEESSPHWSPGRSLFMDHPALLEIAVSNHQHRKEEGLVCINCLSDHPNRDLFTHPFDTAEDAAKALADFLGRSTVRIDRPDVLDPNILKGKTKKERD